MAELTSDYVDSLKDKNLNEIVGFAAIFNHPQNKLWLEDANGNVVIGTGIKNFKPSQRVNLPFIEGKKGGVKILEAGLEEAEFVGQAPVHIAGQQLLLCIVFDKYKTVPWEIIFISTLFGIAIVGGLLAVWSAKRISAPLCRLRNEVLLIGNGNLEKKVTVTGHDEISELAQAVNKMTELLSRKQMQEQQILANISHELRSPIARINLSAIIIEESLLKATEGCAGCMGEEPAPPTQVIDQTEAKAKLEDESRLLNRQLQHLHNIQEEVELLEKLVGKSLLSGRLSLQGALVLSPVDFAGLCAEAARRHNPLFANRELCLKLNINPELWVMADESLLYHCVSNLLDNAVKYTPQNGMVLLTLQKLNGQVVMCLENTAPQMPAEWLEGIFQPFNRGGRTDASKGTGLGLFLVQKIITLHKGQVTCSNGDFGLRFCLSLSPYTQKEKQAL